MFHTENQDTESEAWKTLLELIDDAAAKGAKSFEPLRKLRPGQESELVTLPASIATLKDVEELKLYGSSLVRIPPEIGQMESLRNFDVYTSYRLHWFPYEITRCMKLRSSRVSTRALYGNFKVRPAFPRLEPETETGGATPVSCSVCNERISAGNLRRRWISLAVATDVLPLLVNACSEECIARLPTAFAGYVEGAHTGGLDLPQPPPPSRAAT